MQAYHQRERSPKAWHPSSGCARPGNAGAALIVALSVLLVLLSLGITFALMVRFESEMAAQVYQSARADQLLDGVLSTAMYQLNRDLEAYPDALSLDHGWRARFSGAAFVGKDWARMQHGTKYNAQLYFGDQGLISIDIGPVEQALRIADVDGSIFANGLLYIQFLNDFHMEPLFRGPRTAHWVYVPRRQGNTILLFADETEARLVNALGQPLSLDWINAALNAPAGAQRVRYFNRQAMEENPDAFPFVTASFYDNRAHEAGGGYPAEQVNAWGDIDLSGNGMRDAMWMPLARDVDHYGDGIDNMLDGVVDPRPTAEMGFFEPAPFVYHLLGRPKPVMDEDPDVIMNQYGLPWHDREFPGVDPDDPRRMELRLTVPLPGMTMQVDLNSDGIFDDRDHYIDAVTGQRGPIFVRLPDVINVPVITGFSGNAPLFGRIPLTMANVDTIDNNHDLMVNSFRNYAYVGAHTPWPDYTAPGNIYDQFQIPYREEETGAARNRAYHEINVDAVLGGPQNLELFFIVQSEVGTAGPNVGERVPIPATSPIARILRQPGALRVTCSGEPVSEIVGRYAVHITDEAGKANLNTAGGYRRNLRTGERFRALAQGATPFEYETRILPGVGITYAQHFWDMRTGGYLIDDPLFNSDLNAPGYGGVDDNGNALLLALSGRDDSGSGFMDDGLYIPPVTPLTLSAYRTSATPTADSPLERLYAHEMFATKLTDHIGRIGLLEGIDEPSELRLFNPLRNLVAENQGEPYGAMGDRLFLRKEELTRHRNYALGLTNWNKLRNVITVNSDTRNLFSVEGGGVKRTFLKLDPNTASYQHLAATLLIKGDVTNIVDSLPRYNPTMNLQMTRFAEGLRQFDVAFTGHLMGHEQDWPNDIGARFPADPVLQTMRLAVDMAAARKHTPGRHKLITENSISAAGAYQEYLVRRGLPPLNPPVEPLNERERILSGELLPVGEIQEYLEDNLGLSVDDKRLIAPDPWWKDQTGEDRLFEYATASMDAIRINEIMVRPVRRVEAETQRSADYYTGGADGDWLLADFENPMSPPPILQADLRYNLDPSRYSGMLTFDVITPAPNFVGPGWALRSAYDDLASGRVQPLLGDRTAWVLDNLASTPAENIVEFRFRPSDGLPPGRYYLTVNMTDQFGRMTVNAPGVLQYAVKYRSVASSAPTITADVASGRGLDLPIWKTVDKFEFIATEAARNAGSAAPPGWVFLPVGGDTDALIASNQMAQAAIELENYLAYSIGLATPDPLFGNINTTTWPVIVSNILIPWFDATLSAYCPAIDPLPATWELLLARMNQVGCVLPEPAPEGNPAYDFAYTLAYRWFHVIGVLDAVIREYSSGAGYFVDGTPRFPPPGNGQPTHTVVIPDYGDDLELCIALRLNPTLTNGNLPLAVNFFDFSQEPSHEYLELVNISDETVDVGGWHLEVGIPDPPGVKNDPFIKDPYKSVWRIPDNTRIAAGGHLLLGFDVFDFARFEPPDLSPSEMGNLPQGPVLGVNGIGLASGLILPAAKVAATDPMGVLEHLGEYWMNRQPELQERLILYGITPTLDLGPVSSPPMADISADPVFAPLSDGTGSVFRRAVDRDYIDNDGDGLSSLPIVMDMDSDDIEQMLTNAGMDMPDDILAALDTDNVLAELRAYAPDRPLSDMLPAWSRIVQLENVQLWLGDAYYWSDDGTAPPWVSPDPQQAYHDRLNPYQRSRSVVTLGNIDSVERLAQLVLRGGVFPNYPERDGIDNDGDGGYVTDMANAGETWFGEYDTNAVWTTSMIEPLLGYVPGTLDKDMIDNNLNGRIDSRGVEIPFDVLPNGYLQCIRHGNPLLSDGVDEGRLGVPVRFPSPPLPMADWPTLGMPGYLPRSEFGRPRFFGHGSFEAGDLPLYNLDNNNLTGYRNDFARRLMGNRDFLYDFSTGDVSAVVNGANVFYRPEYGFPFWLSTPPPTSYDGVVNPDRSPALFDDDSPEWKAFVERRWNPGDNVIVTLYVGPPSARRVADQATYHEYDVINRTIDDLVPCPYIIDGYRNYFFDPLASDLPDGSWQIIWGGANGSRDVASLDPDRPTFWQPDHMGLDFYRSLERKHPLYHGDRFGLANRWTPTSGAYDDWAESMSPFVDAYAQLQDYSHNAGAAGMLDGRLQARFQPDVHGTNAHLHQQQMFGHAFWGSPLRMNTHARILENPATLPPSHTPGVLYNHRAPGSDAPWALRQFAGLDAYRNTHHDLEIAGNTPAADAENRLNQDWALRRALLRHRPYAAVGDLMDLPMLTFERVLDRADGADQLRQNWALVLLDTSTDKTAVTPVNSRFLYKKTEDGPVLFFTDVVNTYAYSFDRDLSGALLGQAVFGGGAAVYPRLERQAGRGGAPVFAEFFEALEMNPVALTVGQARVAPLWPAPDTEYPEASGAGISEDMLRGLFQWDGAGPSYMWTPVHLFTLPGAVGEAVDIPWQQAQYPARYDAVTGSLLPPYRISGLTVDGDIAPLMTGGVTRPPSLFNGAFLMGRWFSNFEDEDILRLATRWPMRRVAAVVATDDDPLSPGDRAVMYVSRYRDSMGENNRPEALFVWDRESGLENGTYMAYIGTFIPGMRERFENARDMLNAYYDREGISSADREMLIDVTGADILRLDPTHPQRLANPDTRRFDTQLLYEFITDPRYAERVLPLKDEPFVGERETIGLPHPLDWRPRPESITDPFRTRDVYRADDSGYIFSSADPHVQWQPIPVRVTNNYLALRVRNMGGEGQVACITHVVLAPAQRTRGAINLNTAETHLAVGGENSPIQWNYEMFNAIMGLPGIINPLNVTMNPNRPPLSGGALGLPTVNRDKNEVKDPWRDRWPAPAEFMGTLADSVNARPYPLLPDGTTPTTGWSADRDGRALLRLMSLLVDNRRVHPDGRYYTSLADLLDGIALGGVARVPDGADGPWPLSNLGGGAAGANVHERRFEEIQERFRRLSNMTTTRSDVFEIIVRVQSGSVMDIDGDGVPDYRGDEFFPLSEAGARVIYDRRARTMRQDESRGGPDRSR